VLWNKVSVLVHDMIISLGIYKSYSVSNSSFDFFFLFSFICEVSQVPQFLIF
jgi:hypothetical protein